MSSHFWHKAANKTVCSITSLSCPHILKKMPTTALFCKQRLWSAECPIVMCVYLCVCVCVCECDTVATGAGSDLWPGLSYQKQGLCPEALYYISRVGQTVYIHRIWPSIWWFPCQKYRTCTVYIWFWPTLSLSLYIYIVCNLQKWLT